MIAAARAQRVRKVGLVCRVSTDGQLGEEGSLTTQLQRMRQLMNYKSEAVGEPWVEAGLFNMQVVSGKDSLRSVEFRRLVGEIQAGNVNTVLCTELSRICRNVKEFLEMLEELSGYDVEFASVKEQFDTTTAQGRLVMIILMAIAQFEREQTSERTQDAVAARSERGLWNGGQLFGFDLDPDRKGHLIPNELELPGVELAMDAFLEHGTIAGAQEVLNRAGYRTKGYTSRRGVPHSPHEFSFTTVQHMLKNPAYIGQKRVGDRTVPAVWPAVIDEAKFQRVQDLLAANAGSKHSVAKAVRHTYVLSGLLRCGPCTSALEGRSGTGRLGTTYFYYACRNKDCGLRVPADSVESEVLARLHALATDSTTINALVTESNSRLERGIRSMRKRHGAQLKMLESVRADASQRLDSWSGIDDENARTFVTQALGELKQRQDDLERSLLDVRREIDAAEAARVSAEGLRCALGRFNELYECLQPYERKELIRLFLSRAEIGEHRMTLEIRAGFAGPTEAPQGKKSGSRSERPIWLPGSLAESPIRDRFSVQLPSIVALQSRETRGRRKRGAEVVRAGWLEVLDAEAISGQELARRSGLSRARINQVLRG